MSELLRLVSSNVTAASAIMSALIAALCSALIALSVSRRSLYISTVTVERSKWIDKLRKNIAELVGELNYLYYRKSQAEVLDIEQFQVLVRRVSGLITEIELQLNPHNEIDANLIKLLRAMSSSSDYKKHLKLGDIFVLHAQWLLKAEWEKVKFEARGLFSRWFWERPKRFWRSHQYKKFAENEGSIARIIES